MKLHPKNLWHTHFANIALAIELTTLGAVIVFMIAATLGQSAATFA
jgi:hypothetical protein